MNKRYLGIGLFLAGCSVYSLVKAIQLDFDSTSLSLFAIFGFLGFMFLRHLKK